jgi:hypothetical protein
LTISTEPEGKGAYVDGYGSAYAVKWIARLSEIVLSKNFLKVILNPGVIIPGNLDDTAGQVLQHK